MADPVRGEPAPRGLLSLLSAQRDFRSLWTARLISFFGDSMGLIALLLYTSEHFRSGIALALLMLASDFVPSLLSPLAGAVSDRWDRRKVMVSCELSQAALLAVIALTLPSLPVLLGMVAAQACVATVFQPASRSAVPSLVAGPDLERANAAIGFGTNGMDAFAPLAGAVLLTWLSIRDLLFLDAATFAISAALLLALPPLAPSPAEPGSRLLLGQAREGLAYLWRHRVIRVITLAFCVVVMFNAVDDVALVRLATRTLHGSNSAASLLYAGAGIGLLAGFLLLARARPNLAIPLMLIAGYAVSSLGNLLTGVWLAVIAAFGFQVLRGLGLAAMDVGHNTLIQRSVPAELLGRVFGNVYGAVGVAAGMSYVLGGLLLDATDARVTFVVAGAGGLVATAVAAIVLPRALRAASH